MSIQVLRSMLVTVVCLAACGTHAFAQQTRLQYEVVTELIKLGCRPLNVLPGEGDVKVVVALDCTQAQREGSDFVGIVVCNAYETPTADTLITATAGCRMIR